MVRCAATGTKSRTSARIRTKGVRTALMARHSTAFVRHVVCCRGAGRSRASSFDYIGVIMRFVTKWALVMALFAWIASPSPAQAQDDGRLSLSITPAMATISGDSEFALAGTVDYRFARHLSFEGDITWINAAAG